MNCNPHFNPANCGDDYGRRRDPAVDAAPLETVALGDGGDDDAPSRDGGAAGDAPSNTVDDSMRNATPLMNRKLPVSGGAGWLSARAPAQHEATGIHIHLAAHGGTTQIEIAGARLDDRRVGVSARLSRAELRELIRTLVMTRERWDAACGEGL